jgi:hypothetical protein
MDSAATSAAALMNFGLALDMSCSSVNRTTSEIGANSAPTQ